MKPKRRQFTTGFKEQAVARLSAPGAALNGVDRDLDINASQLRIWKLDLVAAGPTEALGWRKVDTENLPKCEVRTIG